MLKFARPFLFMVFAALFATPADAWLHHGSGAAAACPQSTDNGCAAAPAHGSFKDPTLLTAAQQSGQNSLLPTRAGGLLTLNIPGVDYGVGPDSTLTPQDPRNITWNSTTPCSYIGTGGNAPPNDYVGCYTSGTYPNAALNNYDFSGLKIGKSAIPLYLNSDALSGSKMTITNSYFAPNPSTVAQNLGFGFLGNWSVVFKNNQCDGSLADAGSDSCIRSDGDLTGTTFDFEYNAFPNTQVRSIIDNIRYGVVTFKYNFVRGLNDLHQGGHGEVAVRACPLQFCTGSEDYEGNFIIWNTNLTQTQNNATFYISDGNPDNIHLSSVSIINNIVITNSWGNPATPTSGANVGKALFEIGGLAHSGVVTISGNWVDPTGSFFCGDNGGVNNGNNTASASGNTLTVTGPVNGTIQIDSFVANSGFTTAQITAFGTGTGGAGTYTFGGAPQTQGSTSTWFFVPGYTGTPTLAPNWGLADPSHTGSPAALGFSDVSMLAGNCVGHQ